jgi:hypothetical protein
MAERGDPEAQQFLQLLQQQEGGQPQPMRAQLGAKLRTIEKLNNICPDGYELKVHKVGGKICKTCVEKAKGGDIKPKNPAEEYKIAKAQEGKKVQQKELPYNKSKHDRLVNEYQAAQKKN